MFRNMQFSGIITRLLIGIVVFFNLLCAGGYLVSPQLYLDSYALSADNGIPIIRGIGILFVMWNVPYLFALFNPFRHRLSLYEAIIMQFIGVAGETWILFTHHGLAETTIAMINRFIYFDAFGLLALIASFIITLVSGKTNPSSFLKQR